MKTLKLARTRVNTKHIRRTLATGGMLAALALITVAACPAAHAQQLYVAGYVTSTDTGHIYQLTTGGAASDFTSQNFYSYTGLAFAPSGVLYAGVGAAGGYNIVKIDGTGTKFDSIIGASSPEGLAFGTGPNLYVANYGNNTISKVDTTTDTFTTFVDNTKGLNIPTGLVYDGAGNFFVANRGNNTVNKIDSLGNVTVYANAGSGINDPFQLALDTSGNLFVANKGNSTIIKIDATDHPTLFATASSGLNSPIGITLDDTGNIYVSNQRGNTITKFDGGGNVLPFNVTGLPTDGLGFLTFRPAQQGGGQPINGGVPEPGEWAFYGILGLTVVALVVRRRTRITL